MGCCQSSLLKLKKPSADVIGRGDHSLDRKNHHHQNGVDSSPADEFVPPFLEFSFADLKAATNNFSIDHIVSESSDKSPNVVYKGRLQKENNQRFVAVKKFTKAAWPDHQQFAVRTDVHCFFFFFNFPWF